ncbi:uncharacterized protein METZ01_LOCUS247769, partial [marine metagenome]
VGAADGGGRPATQTVRLQPLAAAHRLEIAGDLGPEDDGPDLIMNDRLLCRLAHRMAPR